MEFPSTEMHEHVAFIFYLSGTNATLDRCFFFLFCFAGRNHSYFQHCTLPLYLVAGT